MLEFDGRQHFVRPLQGLLRHVRVSLLRDEFDCVVGRQLIDEEEIGGGEHLAQQLDALTDERGDSKHSLGRDVEPSFAHDWQQALAQVFDAQSSNVFRVEPERFGIESVFMVSDT